MLKSWYTLLGAAIYHYRGWVLASWLLIAVGGGILASRAPTVLESGSGELPGTPSARVAEIIASEFATPLSQLLVVTIGASEAIPAATVQEVQRTLAGSTLVRRVLGPDDPGGFGLRSSDARQAAWLLGLNAGSEREAERAVPGLRRLLTDIPLPADVQLSLTGRAAMLVDINTLSAADTAVAEARVLPITLLILLVAFGSLLAAGLPLAMGMATTTVAMGLVFLVGRSLPLSSLAQSVVTMVGLAVGIDYSLIVLKRFREGLRAGHTIKDAVSRAMATAGRAVTFSALTVISGLGGLLFTPLLETRSIGLGGLLVVLLSLLAALTLLPALLSYLGPRIDLGSSWLIRSPLHKVTGKLWTRWAQLVMDRPIRALLVGGIVLAALSYPAMSLRLGFPAGHWLPEHMEAIRGFRALAAMGQGQIHAPLHVLVTAQDGAILAAKHLAELRRIGDRLKGDRRVHQVRSAVDLAPGMTLAQAYLLYADRQLALARFPAIAEFFLARDGHATLIEVILKDEVTLAELQALTREVGVWSAGGGLQIQVGGWGAYYNDFDTLMARTYPRVMGLVLASTFIVLFWAFRSLLIPLKALVLNLCSVAAGYGMVVLVFQHGVGASLFGLDRGLGAVPAVVPILLFCLLFGLSMDYEVFLLARIKEEYDAHGDNRRAVAHGLAMTAGMITSAALVMVVVFGAFAWAQIAIVKMLGFGLAVAVLVDATIIRALLVPALMRVAGNWNWYPGKRPEH
ncbi:MAG: MMPL family transporter [Cyanobacteria bacterium NC_groundwater_1444_Ag_S-0.65um_54_12]|nr:MMPL family transporter [Cyanobacteria bacterium NC_groundwater_1444_Ag_S-0.65um_54_12]